MRFDDQNPEFDDNPNSEKNKCEPKFIFKKMCSKLDELEKSTPQSMKLIQILLDDDNLDVCLWIDAPAITFRSQKDVDQTISNLKEIRKTRLPGFKIILEAYITDSIREELTRSDRTMMLSIDTPSCDDVVHTANNASLYASKGDEAMTFLRNGIYLATEEENDDWQIPECLLKSRIPDWLDQIGAENWKSSQFMVHQALEKLNCLTFLHIQ